MGTINVFNVKDNGASGDGINDDTLAIQYTLDLVMDLLQNNLSNNRGASVYFPPGIYLVTSTLFVPPRCTLFGFCGNITQTGIFAANYPFWKRQPTIIKGEFIDTANLIEFYPIDNIYFRFDKAESTVIKDLAFIGDKNNCINGLSLNAAINNEYYNATGLVLENLHIQDFKNHGLEILGGANFSYFKEVTFRNMLSYNNGNCGYFIDCIDANLYDLRAAGNNIGFHFCNRGAARCFNLDSYGNNKGLLLEDTNQSNFFRLTCDNNQKEGCVIKNSNDIIFESCNFIKNSLGYPNMYSELKIEENAAGWGAMGIVLNNCRFGYYIPNPLMGFIKTKYAIEDTSNPSVNFARRNNIICNCTFKEASLLNGVANNYVFSKYIFSNCISGNDGDIRFQNPSEYIYVNTFEPNPQTVHLTGNTKQLVAEPGEEDITVILPALMEVDKGKTFDVLIEQSIRTVTFVPFSGDKINKVLNSIVITPNNQVTLKIVKLSYFYNNAERFYWKVQ